MTMNVWKQLRAILVLPGTVIHGRLKLCGKLLVAEPKIHVPGRAFRQTVTTAEELGFRMVEEPKVHGCRAVVLERAAV
jgi:hypothetical protein